MPPQFKMEAVILAGGLGTRLRPAVSDVSKVMAPIHGRPFLHYQLAFWANQGVRRFVLSVGYKSESILNYFGDNFEGVPVEYCIESTPMGTGGGFLLASQKVETDTFLLINGDTFCDADLGHARRFHEKTVADLTVFVARIPRNDRYGTVVLDPESRVTRFRQPSGAKNSQIHAGIYLFQRSLVDSLASRMGTAFSLEKDILMEVSFLEKTRVFGFESTGFIDIGTPEDYARAKTLFSPA